MSLHISNATKHEAIKDALLRAVLAIDTNDIVLFESALIERDKVSFIMNGNAQDGLDIIVSGMFNNVGPLDTTHFITNIRVISETDSAATFTASALAQHFRTGEGNSGHAERLMSGSLYTVDVEHDSKDGLWKFRKWAMNLIWHEGEMSVVMPK